MTDLDQLLQQVERNVAAERGPLARLRALSTRRRWSLVGLVAGALLLVAAVATPRPDLDAYPVERLLAELGILVLAGIAALLVRLRPAHRPLAPTWQGWVAGLVTLSVGLLLVLVPQAHTGHAEAMAGGGETLVPRAVACLLFGLGFAIPFAALGRILEPLPGGSPLVAAAAGLLGMAALVLHCPIIRIEHLVLGHLPVLVLLILAASAVFRRIQPGRRGVSRAV